MYIEKDRYMKYFYFRVIVYLMISCLLCHHVCADSATCMLYMFCQEQQHGSSAMCLFVERRAAAAGVARRQSGMGK